VHILDDLGWIALGGVLLYLGAEWLVRGAAGLAAVFGVRPLAIGLTVVSYGTSAPELAVSVLAALEKKSDIVLGNVIGSNIANIGLILGLTALVAPPKTDGAMWRRELPILLGTTALLPLMLIDGTISRLDAAALAVGTVSFTYYALRKTRGKPKTESTSAPEAVAKAPENRLTLSGLTLVGLVGLVLGGRSFVAGAIGLAQDAGLSERIVGLTIVAIGTSLPELAASAMAAFRGHPELALGNVVGSNIFNVLFILGVSGLVSPLVGSLGTMWLDFTVMGVLTVLCALSLRKPRSVTRAEGIMYAVSYSAFIAVVVVL
jgi:cation:H+ antiporter